MTNFTEQAEFAQTIPKLKRGSGFKGLEQRLNQLIQPLVNRSRFLSEQNTGGGGFAFGGEWDATKSPFLSTPELNVFSNSSAANSVITYTDAGVATATDIVFSDLHNIVVQFVYPNIVSQTDTMSAFSISINEKLSSAALNDRLNGIGANTDENAVAFTIMQSAGTYFNDFVNSVSGTNAVASQQGSFSSHPVSGDVIQILLDAVTGVVLFYNVTQNTQQGSAVFDISMFTLNETRLKVNIALIMYGASSLPLPTVTYLFDANGFKQATDIVQSPEDADGKTYIVINTDEDSIYDNKQLKNGDFATFYNDAANIFVSRLYTDDEISVLANTAIDNALEVDGSIYNAIQTAVNP